MSILRHPPSIAGVPVGKRPETPENFKHPVRDGLIVGLVLGLGKFILPHAIDLARGIDAARPYTDLYFGN